MIRHIFLRTMREPLIHFLILGAGLFGVYSAVNGTVTPLDDRIVVDEAQVQRLAEQFQRIWMRLPDRQELQSLAEEYVKEEILYREALSLGLDQDDLVIRRRLRQKIEFLYTDLTEPEAPTNEQLQAYLDENHDRFRRADLFSFEQIYVNPRKSSSDAKLKVAHLLNLLCNDPAIAADPTLLGDATMLPSRLDGVTRSDVTNTFGRGFAEDIEDMPLNHWSGPYESSYGLHLVRIVERESGDLPGIEEIRSVLENEWYAEHRKEADERFYQAIRARYDVEICLPADSTGKTLAVVR